MNTGGGLKRGRKSTQQKKVTRQFRPPRQADTPIPRLMRPSAVEKKVLFTGTIDPINGYFALNSTGSIYAMNLAQVGSSMFNRIGRRIMMKSVRLRFQIQPILGIARTSFTDLGKIALVYDKQTNGAYPGLADVYQDTDQSGANTSTTLSGLNMNNRDRFITIMEKCITLAGGTIAVSGIITNPMPQDQTIMYFDEYRKLNLTTHFRSDSNPAVIGDISNGALYLISFAQLVAGAEIYQINWNCRLKYIDL